MVHTALPALRWFLGLVDNVGQLHVSNLVVCGDWPSAQVPQQPQV